MMLVQITEYHQEADHHASTPETTLSSDVEG